MTTRSITFVAGICVLLAALLVTPAARAQTPPRPAATAAQAPRVAPRGGYQFHDENTVEGFVVQRWVSTASPEVSPAGMCECLTLVYQGSRRLVTLGAPDAIAAISVVAPTGRDVNRDGWPDIVVSDWSGGAHCFYTTTVYSTGPEVRTVLSVNTGDCGPGEFADLDADGVLEFSTCDPAWGYRYCSFAFSPFPPVVHTYDAGRGTYRVATPRFAGHFRDGITTGLADARTHFATTGRDTTIDKCVVLQPALRLMYTGRTAEGRSVIRTLYRGADAAAFERDVMTHLQSSSQWAP